LFAAPEGAACLPAYKTLVQQGFLKKTDKVVIFNTGSGLKYLESTAEALGISTHQPASHMSAPATRKIGGIIQPY
jgi:threonine synthase